MSSVTFFLLNAAVWVVIHTVVGYLAHRLPPRLLERETWLTRGRRFERGGRLYVRVFRIKRWKHLLPEAGALFAGGFDKRRLTSSSEGHLSIYLRETRRAELAHWATAAMAPLFFLWNPLRGGVMMIVYAVVVNGPCVASQRYNRLRLQRIAGRRSSAGAAPPLRAGDEEAPGSR